MTDLRSFLQVISTFKLWLQAEACFRCRRALLLYVLRVRQHWINHNKIVILEFFIPADADFQYPDVLFHIAIFFLVKNSLISPCFAVLRTDPHNYLWTIKPARCVHTRCWGHYQKPLLILSDPPPLKSYAFHSLRGVQSINILKIYLNFIFIPNPDIASWQFPPVKLIMKKSGFIELHVLENEPFSAFTPI